jgi:hAT family protein
LDDSDDSEFSDEGDEFDRWQQQKVKSDRLVTNPILYWQANRHLWPRLARMAFDLLGIPASSSECERTFSDAGEVVTKRRNRLAADVIGACLCLKQWDRDKVINWQ